MNTFHIHIKGRVQGVGFRPFVYQKALELGIKGWVCNATDGLHVRGTAKHSVSQQFYQICQTEKPELAVITESSFREVNPEAFDDFQIVESQNRKLEINISPDFAICSNCLAELHNPQDRRLSYPFITCTHCGPRYSILSGLPYDRPFTVMNSFEMCGSCKREYNEPLDRRYYSQTNSCQTCGIQLKLCLNNQKFELDQKEILTAVNRQLKEDKIIAVKGIGGFLLLCDAASEKAIRILRKRKQRPTKPFAVLFPNIIAVEEHFHICKEEKDQLLGPVSPIVLLSIRNRSSFLMDWIAPGLDSLGVMIPYAPLLEIISSGFAGPLIATSANISGAPIIHEEDISALSQLADIVLDHNRPITFPQDDSVIQFSPFTKRQIVLRRSRGISPSIFQGIKSPNHDTLALGAEMKGSFGLTVNNNTYISQYLGNLSHYDNRIQFERILNSFLGLVSPELKEIVVDEHPGYFSHEFGKTLVMERNISLTKVQHHKAHFAAILNEKELMHDDKVLGVVWDGTGYGSDGHIWGGEFFEYHNYTMHRVAHLAYFNNLAFDRMALDNRLCALSILGIQDREKLKPYFKSQEWDFYNKALDTRRTLSSSMGRVFDAVAFLSGLSQENNYEGQAAMLVEQDARKAFASARQFQPYSFSLDGDQVSLERTFHEIMNDREHLQHDISARFHLTLVEIIRTVAKSYGFEKVAFSGGVFQNGLLMDLISNQLHEDFQLYFHTELSPNDENIAYGQLAYAQNLMLKENQNLKQFESCV